VQFKLGNTTLGGGETITTEGGSSTTAVGRTNNGFAKVTIKSGTVAGNIDVIATVDTKEGLISTSARVTVVSNVPDADHLSLSVQYHNIAGGVTFGLLDDITAFVGDRFGNIVPDNTAVSFITEGGTIGKSIEGGAFTSTTTLGQAQAVLQSAGPTTPHLGGMPTLKTAGYSCSETPPKGFPNYPLYPFMRASRQRDLCGNPGLVTVVAYTVGSESFIDVNGNGYFDAGDRHSHLGYIDANNNKQWDEGEMITNQGDVSEPFIDGNDNGIFEEGELYVDVNSNGRFDGPDGQFQSNTVIWSKITVLFSGPTTPLKVIDDATGQPVPENFSIAIGEKKDFIIINLFDSYGNALVGGSELTVTATSPGIVKGDTAYTFRDTMRAEKNLRFSLSVDEESQDLDEDIAVTVSLESPISNSGVGGNGNERLTFKGRIKIPGVKDN
jgi:adhesin/invasin